MRPVLFEFFGQPIHAYTFFLSMGFLVATLWCVRDAERLKEPLYLPTQHAVWLFLGGLVGSKAYFILQYDTPLNLWKAVLFWEGGLVYYGALIGGASAAVIVMYRLKLPYLKVTDAIIPFVPLAQATGRMGCFLNGCCWGEVTDAPWAVRFPKGSLAHQDHISEGLLQGGEATSLAVHPTQLYSAAGLILLFFFLRQFLREKPFDGSVMFMYMLGYGTLRFVTEMFRGDSAQSVFDMLTVSQTVSLGLVCVALGGFGAYFRWRGVPAEVESRL